MTSKHQSHLEKQKTKLLSWTTLLLSCADLGDYGQETAWCCPPGLLLLTVLMMMLTPLINPHLLLPGEWRHWLPSNFCTAVSLILFASASSTDSVSRGSLFDSCRGQEASRKFPLCLGTVQMHWNQGLMCVEALSCHWPITQPLACCWLELATSCTGALARQPMAVEYQCSAAEALFENPMACFSDAPFVFYNGGGSESDKLPRDSLMFRRTGFAYTFRFTLSCTTRSELWNRNIRHWVKCHFFAITFNQKLNLVTQSGLTRMTITLIKLSPTFLLFNLIVCVCVGVGGGSISSREINRWANLDSQRSNNIYFNQCTH